MLATRLAAFIMMCWGMQPTISARGTSSGKAVLAMFIKDISHIAPWMLRNKTRDLQLPSKGSYSNDRKAVQLGRLGFHEQNHPTIMTLKYRLSTLELTLDNLTLMGRELMICYLAIWDFFRFIICRDVVPADWSEDVERVKSCQHSEANRVLQGV